MNKLAYWCNLDVDLMIEAFQSSPYAVQKDSKHLRKLEREDYLHRTALKAIADCKSTAQGDKETYQLNRKKQFEKARAVKNLSFSKVISSPKALKKYTLDDIGASRLFADIFRGYLLYVAEYKAWWVYESGYWSKDEESILVRNLTKELSDYIMSIIPPKPEPAKEDEEDSDLLKTRPEDSWGKYRKHYSKYRSFTARKTLIQDSQDQLNCKATAFDTQAYLYNCKNGTLNLRTGKLQAHNPEDLISKQANVVYNSKAKSDRFIKFIDEITEGNRERARMLQKSLGYCLKGEANEECYFTAIGEKTRNGKGTLFDTILHLFGNYGAQIDFASLARSNSRDGSRATPDLARLIGTRYVLSNEPDRGIYLNEALLKQITGGDDITVRPLYGNPIQFKPVFRLFITANSKPNVSDDSLFASGRVKILPFYKHFSEKERDSSLKSELRTLKSMSGILNWLLEGYKMYCKEGLKNTDEMDRLVNDYRRENDYVGQYLNDRVRLTPGNRENRKTVKAIRTDYDLWCQKMGIISLGYKMFKSELTKHDVRIYEVKHVHYLDAVFPHGYAYVD